MTTPFDRRPRWRGNSRPDLFVTVAAAARSDHTQPATPDDVDPTPAVPVGPVGHTVWSRLALILAGATAVSFAVVGWADTTGRCSTWPLAAAVCLTAATVGCSWRHAAVRGLSGATGGRR